MVSKHQQWGYLAKGSTKASYPIRFSENPFVILGIEYTANVVNGNTFLPKESTITLSSFEFINNERDKRYFALGK